MRQVLLVGVIGGILVAALKWTEYRFLVVEHSLAIYGGLTAAMFALLGLWLGSRMGRTLPEPPQPVAVPEPVAVQVPDMPEATSRRFVANDRKREELGVTRRELEILELIADGLSNREIAAKLFVSENTVKTHCSRTFEKLGAKRRTQAVQLGKELGLLP